MLDSENVPVALDGVAKALAGDELFRPVGEMLDGVARALAGDGLAHPVGQELDGLAVQVGGGLRMVSESIDGLAIEIRNLAKVFENKS
jgi:hypothetical protein